MVLVKDTARGAAKTAAAGEPPAEEHGEQHEQLVLSGTEVEPITGGLEETHFRLADQYLQTTIRHLRKLRHLPAARDALKLVRQAQNLLMDAEDERTHEGTRDQ